MNITIQSIHFKADNSLLDYIREKTDKLIQFYEHIVTGEVSLKLENSSDMQNKVVQIRLHIPGNDLFTVQRSRTFEEATDLCVETLSKQIKKHKEKQRGI